MVSLAQRMWEGLRQDGKRSTYRPSAPESSSNTNQNHNQSSNDAQSSDDAQPAVVDTVAEAAIAGPSNGHTSQANPQSNTTTDKGRDMNSNASSSQTKDPEPRCFNCGQPGHFQNACPELNERPPPRMRIQHKRTIEEVSDSSDGVRKRIRLSSGPEEDSLKTGLHL